MNKTIACFFALCVACGGGSNGSGPNQCISGAACTPSSGAAACQTYATVCTGNVSSCVATAQSDGTACGGGNVCSAGACVAACVPGQTCTPAQADPCHVFQTSCDSTLTQASCTPVAAFADGTECGNLQACTAGVCVPSSTRLVSSRLQTIYLHDDGTSEQRPGWDDVPAFGAQVTALVVPDSTDPTGYRTFPVTVGADSSFSVPDVPFGPYFIQIDAPSSRFGAAGQQVTVLERTLYEASTGAPDLSIVVAHRPDLQFDFTANPTVQFNVTQLAPVVAGDTLRTFSSENMLNANFIATSRSTFTPPAVAGATSINATTSWIRAAGIDPDASKGDVTWIWQRRTVPAPAGASLLNSLTFARVSNFTVDPSTGGTLNAAMTAVPQTGRLPRVSWSQFAALGPAIHPGATPSSATQPFIGLDAIPLASSFPDEPLDALPREPSFIDPQAGAGQFFAPQTFAAEATVAAPLGTTADADYSSIASGQFFDAAWRRTAQIFYSFDVPLVTSSGLASTIVDGGLYRAFVQLDTLAQPVAPLISAPSSPQLAGNDAFAFQAGVGEQPRISWSAPAIGTATSYVVSIGPFKQFQNGEVALLTAVLFDQTEFVPPAGFLQAGIDYYGQITAVSSPAHLDDPILGLGVPIAQTSLLFGFFTP